MLVIYIFDCSFGRLSVVNCAALTVLDMHCFLKSVLIDLRGSYTSKPEYSTAVCTNFLLYLHLCLGRLNHCFKLGEFLG